MSWHIPTNHPRVVRGHKAATAFTAHMKIQEPAIRKGIEEGRVYVITDVHPSSSFIEYKDLLIGKWCFIDFIYRNQVTPHHEEGIDASIVLLPSHVRKLSRKVDAAMNSSGISVCGFSFKLLNRVDSAKFILRLNRFGLMSDRWSS